MNIIYNLSKKIKYLILSFLIALLLGWFSFSTGMPRVLLPFITALVGLLGTIFVQYTSFKSNQRTLFFSTFINILALPLILVLGAILSLIYFPNLSTLIKVFAVLGVGVFMYIIQLVNNIFLVVYDRNETIPLYRVGATWSQILVVVLSIPFYAGIFKIPINSVYQSLIVAIVAGLFTLFIAWVTLMDPEITDSSRGEQLIESGIVSFIVFAMSIGTSFIPTESFLRALFLSSILMSSLGYLQAHYKNKINKKLIFEYLFISLIFLLFVLIFRQ